MTRSVEIPKSAIEAAAENLYARTMSNQALCWDGSVHHPTEQRPPTVQQLDVHEEVKARFRSKARTALEAALPYLAPAEPIASRERIAEVLHQAWHGKIHAPCSGQPSCPFEGIVHGMADALLAAGVFREVAPPAGDGGLREALEELVRLSKQGYEINPYEITELLTAHPASPAVPQPVDREALWEAVVKVRDASPRVPNDADSWDIVDAVLAVLAGEQERAGGVEHQTITNPDAARRCPARGYENETCIRPDLHDGSHEWREQEQVEP